MSHVFVIAQKELRSFFVSPIAYVVVGLFALLFGVFFYSSLGFVLRISLQAGMMQGAPPININEFMIRPLFGNTAVIMLFVLPIITMRSYAEEKRSGTMELLRSSPLTDLQIIGGKFLGALALFALMLGVTAIHMSVVFLYGEPELWPVLTGYLGLFLMGASFISIGLLISSATKNQAVAAMVTFAVLLMFWVISWLADPTSGSTTSQVLAYLSVLDHFDDFSKGVIDTSHLMYYVSFITFGLFLTAKSVDSERWRG
jgi:ABC-2 type transport system permease protein